MVDKTNCLVCNSELKLICVECLKDLLMRIGEKDKMIKCISLNQFLDIEFKFCFVCSNKKYCQFYVKNYLFRLCTNCLRKKEVKSFLRKTIHSKGVSQ